MRSSEGFICGIVIPEGNVSDVKELVPTVKDCIERSTILPHMVSTDDGYSSRANYEALRELGIHYVSMNGAKGKKLTGENLWDSHELSEARRNRSAIEGLIGTLKNRYEFGQLRRWGLKAVRAELMEAVIAYNFCRIVEVRAKNALTKRKASA